MKIAVIVLALCLQACGGQPQQGDNSEVFSATVNGKVSSVEGFGADRQQRMYDAVAYIASTSQHGASMRVTINGTVFNVTWDAAGTMHIAD